MAYEQDKQDAPQETKDILPSADTVTAPIKGEPFLQCQIIKENRMQCTNKAYATVDDVPVCRLDLNWMVGRGDIDVTAPNVLDKVKAIDPIDDSDVKRIVETAKENK